MSQIKINIGSGSQFIDGWIGIDNLWNIELSRHPLLKYILYRLNIICEKTYNTQWDNRMVKHDIRKRLPFAENTVDYAFSSHVIEHFTQDEALIICQNVHRVLKKGGIFRLVVPDALKLYVTQYIESDPDEYSSRSEPAANQFIHSIRSSTGDKTNSTFFNRKSKDPVNPPTLIELFFMGPSHKWMYDPNSLKHLLVSAGFDPNNIYEFEYRNGKCPDLDKLEHRKDSIYLEATK
jgi:predicted SAM-dependent methyltransferase